MADRWAESGQFDPLARRAGYRKDDAGGAERELEADAAGLRDNGDYRVLGTYRRGEVRVLVEQNQSPMLGAPAPFAGVAVVHDPVAIVDGPLGRVCVNLADPAADQVLERAHQAVTDPDYQKGTV